ncbi:MAG: GNAT family N-acetyltransferase [Vitreoscilla sp.]
MTLAQTRVEIIDWHALANADRQAVLALEISPAQVEFAGTLAKGIASCASANPEEVAGLAIRADDQVVGWAVLKRGAAAPDWVEPGAVVVSGLRIGLPHQGRGLGSLALSEMAHRVARRWPACPLLMLRVDDGNAAGIRAYQKAGWVETGERRVGRVGVERTMSLTLGGLPEDARA